MLTLTLSLSLTLTLTLTQVVQVGSCPRRQDAAKEEGQVADRPAGRKAGSMHGAGRSDATCHYRGCHDDATGWAA